MSKNNLWKALCSSTLLLGMMMSGAAPVLAKAITLPQRSSLDSWQTLVAAKLNFKVKGVKASRKKTFGIARGACQANEADLVALLPQQEALISALPLDKNSIPVQPTTKAYPTFFVHVPATSAQEADLLIQNADRTEILYETTFELTGESGIVGVQLPPDEAAPLEVGNQYYWSVSLLCPTGSVTGGAFVEGWVERVTPDPLLTQQLDQTALQDRPQFYANAGIWQDTLSTLGKLRYDNDSLELQETWSDLLQSVGLAEIAQAPIVQLEGYN